MKYFDNDMDELFHKAGQDYPLDTGKKDWDTVAAALQTEQNVGSKRSFFNRYLRFLPLLLLLLVPVTFLLTTSNDNTKSNVLTHDPAKNHSSGNTIDKKSAARKITSEKVFENKILTTKGRSPNRSGNMTEEVRTEVGNDNTIREANLQQFQKMPLLTISTESFYPSLLFNSNKITSPAAAIEKTSNVEEQTKNATTSKDQKSVNKAGSVYYGLKVGPDVTTIKAQQVEKLGWSAGVMAGYQFSSRLSVELSAIWSRKKYYTDGKYFDKTRARIPANVNIYYLNGGCDMVEIPIAVRYLFSKSANSFFATAGINSYFMKKEDYYYEADAGTGVYEGHRNYKNSGNHVAATFQLTGGYQFKVLNRTNIRVEPYLQVPLQKVGIGRMPITSAGVHFGLLRNIR